jgi:hypothetical protein
MKNFGCFPHSNVSHSNEKHTTTSNVVAEAIRNNFPLPDVLTTPPMLKTMMTTTTTSALQLQTHCAWPTEGVTDRHPNAAAKRVLEHMKRTMLMKMMKARRRKMW